MTDAKLPAVVRNPLANQPSDVLLEIARSLRHNQVIDATVAAPNQPLAMEQIAQRQQAGTRSLNQILNEALAIIDDEDFGAFDDDDECYCAASTKQ